MFKDAEITHPFYSDVLSLYKEEVSGEQTNRVSLLAGCRSMSKLAVMEQLALDALKSDAAIFESLKDSKARGAYESFRSGYVAFHTSLSRYRLQEILYQHPISNPSNLNCESRVSAEPQRPS